MARAPATVPRGHHEGAPGHRRPHTPEGGLRDGHQLLPALARSVSPARPGKKHERRIALEPWQQEIVDAHPSEFIRGLIHSDGCPITNWTTRTIAGERKRYEYPRYFFTNLSTDIRQLYTDTLDKVGVSWKQANAYNISDARKASVALMDTHVGPKH